MRERYDAAPVRPDQFCCYHCAVRVVIPRRLDQLLRGHTQQEGAGRFSDGVAFDLNNAVRREALETIATLEHLTWRVDATPAAS
jgi:hypothetical protein